MSVVSGGICGSSTHTRVLHTRHLMWVGLSLDWFRSCLEGQMGTGLAWRDMVTQLAPIAQEWTDGLVPSLVRQCVSDESDCFNWIVFDGPVRILLLLRTA